MASYEKLFPLDQEAAHKDIDDPYAIGDRVASELQDSDLRIVDEVGGRRWLVHETDD